MASNQGSLKRREDLHREIVASSPNAIFLVDVASRRFVDVNLATLELLGYERDELLGLRLEDIDLGGPDGRVADVSEVRRRHHEILGERTYRRKSGRTVPVSVSMNLVIRGEQEVVCCYARDISEAIEAEQERERLQRALTLSQKHEAVGRLAAGIAHDFNNQLMVMQLCAQLVGQELEPADPLQRELGELAAAGRSAAGLTRQLLAFSGRQVLRPTHVQVDDVISQQEKMLRRTLGEQIRIETSYDAPSAPVFVDRTQLDQVILNLAINARDAMPDGGTFSLTTSVVDVSEDFVEDYLTLSAGPHVLIKVSDTGVGMDQSTLERVFEPFFTTKETGKGSGLGLATAYGIVKQSGGSIWASSRVGAGTTFRVYLPVAHEETEMVAPVELPEVSDLPTGDETLLVVDDDDMVRSLVSRILRSLGYRVIEAAGPEEALEEFIDPDRGETIDLVLTDIVMPNSAGPDMVREIEKHVRDIRVIFMSGYAEESMRVQKSWATGYIFLEKPLGRSELARAVRTVLDR